MTIKYVLLVNKQGQTRLARYAVPLPPLAERVALEGEVVRKCLARSDKLVREKRESASARGWVGGGTSARACARAHALATMGASAWHPRLAAWPLRRGAQSRARQQGHRRACASLGYHFFCLLALNLSPRSLVSLLSPPPQCSFIEHRGHKIVYRRYASLFFLVGVDEEEVRN